VIGATREYLETLARNFAGASIRWREGSRPSRHPVAVTGDRST